MKKLISLTERQVKVLSKKAKELQISFSEMLRRVLDEYIERINK